MQNMPAPIKFSQFPARSGIAILIVMVSGTCSAQVAGESANRLSLSLTTNVSSGKFGTNERTTILTNDLALSFQKGPLSFDMSVPHVSQISTETTAGATRTRTKLVKGIPVVETKVSGDTVRTNRTSGLGDLTLGMTYTLPLGNGAGTSLYAGAMLKLGTADDQKGLGTGKSDLTFRTGASREIGAWLFGGNVWYSLIGKPTGSAYRNVWGAGLDASRSIGPDIRWGVSVDASRSVSALAKGPTTAATYLEVPLSKNVKVRARVEAGLSKGSPDWSGGVGLHVGL